VAQPTGKTYERLTNLRDAIVYGENIQGFNTRKETTDQSLQTFSEYPLGGYILEGNKVSSADMFLQKIGQHSHILDTFSIFGLIIGSLTLYMMIIPFTSRIGKRHSYRQNIFALIVGGSYLSLIVMNNLTPSIGFAAFFVFPTVYNLLYTNDNA
jgi:hypothetical protein